MGAGKNNKMTKFYTVEVKMTAKTVGSREGFVTFDSYKKEFATIQQVKDHIHDVYGKCSKRQKIYVDEDVSLAVNEGEGVTGAKHVGYVYTMGIVEDANSRGGVNRWYQQDWVEIQEIKATTIII